MISRKSAKLLAEAYNKDFSTYKRSYDSFNQRRDYYHLNHEQLYDYLYENDYEAWFLNSIKKLKWWEVRELKEFIMKIHT
jgi:hypothetical protein